MPDPCQPPTPLTKAHQTELFDSGEAVLDEWLRKRALTNQQSGASRTYVICQADFCRVVGYFALGMGQILSTEATGAMRRNMPKTIPAVMLGRLAIDQPWQGQGLGRALLAEAVARATRASHDVSAGLVVVHAISPRAEAFYLHHGFTRLPVDTPTFALDLVRLEKLQRQTG